MDGNKIKQREESRNFMKFTVLRMVATLTEFLQISRVSQENYTCTSLGGWGGGVKFKEFSKTPGNPGACRNTARKNY